MTTPSTWRRTTRGPGADVTIEVDGRRVRARTGDTVATAMLVAGAPFDRDRTGAARAPLCNLGSCFECAATVDGRPLTRTCLVAVSEGMTVETSGRL
ncbi:(2Fe-2S)-binding protein [Streptomyces castrisilvae]|uniref:(2Fe-2S)-binding protein n=1 Tax=Streptomyces castrisilvae TaxID=3033811 RepID=A0ABY9HBZ0_9ACTN|nr:(2Fe-2S)-binding protein [Streptomyces sp. Mut1]WLQ32028.1 (2Fe-2S)-binding protein [Streptomyces sp. Mut1]